MTVKKITWILIAVALLAVVVAPTMALANNGSHGGYLTDTDMCAQCHRAHTAPSSITWTDNQGAQKNALLLTDSAQAYLFCLACHDDASQGADTNVMGGTYQGTVYGSQDATMLSGPFGSVRADLASGAVYDQNGHAVTSAHVMNGGSWGAFGGGLFGHDSTVLTSTGDPVGNQTDLYGTGNLIVMSCVTCHDPHGSSNYRILKDVVNGVTVGGYNGATGQGNDPFGNPYNAQNPKPNPYVISNEVGFPQGGFQLHVSYIGTYVPSYTTALYAIPTATSATSKGMTGWCVGCHTTYNIASRVTFNGNTNYINDSTSVYNAGDDLGLVARHRHPMNVPLSNYAGASSVVVSDTSLGLPVDHPTSQQRTTGSPVYVAGQYNGDNWIECLTCHNAHGSVATMTGFSDVAALTPDDLGYRGVMATHAGDSSLLKLNNRAVCERCHNK